jgi:HTH-like domain
MRQCSGTSIAPLDHPCSIGPQSGPASADLDVYREPGDLLPCFWTGDCWKDRSTYHYRCRRAGQAELTERIKEIAATRVRYGYRRIHVLLRREGWPVNAKRVYRLYREIGLQLRNKTPKRR